MSKQRIQTDGAPAAIGTYSQAVRHANLVFLSGQIPLDPETMELVSGDFDAEVTRVLDNLQAVAEAAGATLDDAVRITVFLLDMDKFAAVNAAMARYFSKPYPARAALAVSELPRGARVEIDAILSLA